MLQGGFYWYKSSETRLYLTTRHPQPALVPCTGKPRARAPATNALHRSLIEPLRFSR